MCSSDLGAASPMVHLSGAVPLKADMEAFHGVDDPAFVHEMFKKITKWSARVERIDDIPEVMAKAFHIARSGRPGPVHVELPRVSDYSEYILQEPPAVLPAYQRIPATVVKPDPAFVDQCAQRLMAARAPLLAAGKGVIRQGAIGLLTKLAEKLQAPVITAQDSIGLFPEAHPLYAGFFQRQRCHQLCMIALERSDFVLGTGLRAGAAEMSELRERAGEKRMMINGFDDAQTTHYQGPDERVADPKLFLEALLARLGKGLTQRIQVSIQHNDIGRRLCQRVMQDSMACRRRSRHQRISPKSWATSRTSSSGRLG